jgi:putative molybdopterin biosynthesis protein
MSEELLDIKQVQQRLKVSERTVFNLIKRGDLKGFKAGREWRFTMSDIQDYEERQRRKAEQRIQRPLDEAA